MHLTRLCSYSLLALLLAVSTSVARAEDPPVVPPKPAPTPTPEEAQPDTPQTGEEPAAKTPEAEPKPAPKLDPVKDYNTMVRALRRLPRGQMQEARKREAVAYLEKWKAAGQTASGLAQSYLGRIQHFAEDYTGAQGSFRAAGADEKANDIARAQGMLGLTTLLTDAKAQEALAGAKAEGPSDLDRVVAWLDAEASPGTRSLRGSMHRSLGGYFAGQDNKTASVAHYMKAAQVNPAMAGNVSRSIVRSAMDGVYQLEAYEGMATQLRKQLASLSEYAMPYLAELEGRRAQLSAKEPAADATAAERRRYDNQVRSLDRQLASAAAATKLLERYEPTLAKLGKPAEDWTLVHGFGSLEKLESLRGKVVVLDFWATWCPWCIRSFGAIRDVLGTYDGNDLAFVGVTASAGSVYDARYSLDDDLKDRAEGQGRARPVARRARASQTPDPAKGILEESAYKLVEIDTIKKFIENHKMNWPVVMIDPEEPRAKYALGGWPHAVIIDRQGRIRYFKSGALLRDRPEDVAKFRKVLDDLIKEDAPKAGSTEGQD